ncbi:type VI secretion system baseplate subunit TssG [Pseudoduganella ginsengisoli]|uniref:Type VI secretion system baseplate subunit TssG n=1 Tax=Pseudoduganella ginsengisoli TaxID=1462440 RepID=A0A6L6PV61_9BURK|nr:type VI secretion system baseplate subunit TssG [Pseudoduganella ginsengisoli]MTW00994.1 type VI secretion system baseplate subunit TssG [Pseudoduganella ginsengisoli]
MRSTQRLRQPGVIQRLLDEPWRFSFAQAVRLLLRQLAALGVTQEEAYAQVLTFRNSLSLAYPASELAALEMAGDPFNVALTPAYIGLLGAAGALPLHDTQHIADLPPGEQRDGVCAFMDLVSARLMALHCQAGELRRLEHGLATGGADGLLPLLLALSGAQPAPSHPYDHVAAYYAGLLRMRPVSAQAIGQMLAGYFAVPIACRQFAGSWEVVLPERRSVLGQNRPRLGGGAMLGKRLFRPEQGVRIDIGPLARTQLDRFLPGGDASAALAALLRLCAAPLVTFEVCLLLAPQAIRPLVLGPPGQRRRLGWDTFLPDQQGHVEKPEIRYVLDLD